MVLPEHRVRMGEGVEYCAILCFAFRGLEQNGANLSVRGLAPMDLSLVEDSGNLTLVKWISQADREYDGSSQLSPHFRQTSSRTGT